MLLNFLRIGELSPNMSEGEGRLGDDSIEVGERANNRGGDEERTMVADIAFGLWFSHRSRDLEANATEI